MEQIKRWATVNCYLAGLDYHQPIPTKGKGLRADLDARILEKKMESEYNHLGKIQRERRILN